jgi:hypothetical protein
LKPELLDSISFRPFEIYEKERTGMAPACITEGEHAATVRKRIQPPMPVMRAQALTGGHHHANRVGGPNPHFV